MMNASEHRCIEGSLRGVPLPATFRFAAPLTNEDLLTFSKKNPLYRVERNAQGELEVMTPVGGEGGKREALAIAELALWTETNGGSCFSSNTGFSLPDGSMLSPDAAWISDARWNALSEAERSAFPPLCPDFVIEVLSASDSRPVLEAKMRVWLKNGAKLAWLIDPRAGEILIYTAGEEPEALPRPESLEAGAPVPGFRLRADRFWRER